MSFLYFILFFLFLFFYLFLLAFYFSTLILYTADFDPRIHKDIIIIIKWVKDNFKCTSTEFISIRKQKLNSYAA